MAWSRFWQYLSPPQEQDEAIRQEIASLSVAGLKTLAAVEIAAPILTFLIHLAIHTDHGVEAGNLREALAMVAVGVATAVLARWKWARRRPRALAIASAWAGAAVLIWVALLVAREFYGAEDYIPTGVTLILLTIVAAVPLRPLQALALGLAIEVVYAAADLSIHTGLFAPYESSGSHHIFILVLTFLSTGVTAVLYGRRLSDFESHQQALRVTEALTGAQLRAQLAENAASIGKLAAALTHEINTPLGALKSSVDTLLVLAARQATAPPEKQSALVQTQAELRRSIENSAERIRSVVGRLQRFISLEEAEIKTANVNDLLSDVALLFEEKVRESGVQLDFDLQPLPDINCRPQLLSAVFSSLLSNALNAVDGNGRIRLSTRLAETLVEVRVQDNGKGMSPEEVDNIFDPGFRVSEARVSSGNWSLFNARQIIFEHGGDIQIESTAGSGTTVAVTIPC